MSRLSARIQRLFLSKDTVSLRSVRRSHLPALLLFPLAIICSDVLYRDWGENQGTIDWLFVQAVCYGVAWLLVALLPRRALIFELVTGVWGGAVVALCLLILSLNGLSVLTLAAVVQLLFGLAAASSFSIFCFVDLNAERWLAVIIIAVYFSLSWILPEIGGSILFIVFFPVLFIGALLLFTSLALRDRAPFSPPPEPLQDTPLDKTEEHTASPSPSHAPRKRVVSLLRASKKDPREPRVNSLHPTLRSVFRLITLANGTDSATSGTVCRLSRQKAAPQSGAQAVNHRFPRLQRPRLTMELHALLFDSAQKTSHRASTEKTASQKTGGIAASLGRGFSRGIKMLSAPFFLALYYLIDFANTWVNATFIPADDLLFGVGMLLGIAVVIVVQLLARRSVWNLLNVFFALSSIGFVFIVFDAENEGFTLSASLFSLLYGAAESIGCISVFYVVGTIICMSGKQSVFRCVCLIAFLVGTLLPTLGTMFFLHAGNSARLLALATIIACVALYIVLLPLLHEQVFSFKWIDSLVVPDDGVALDQDVYQETPIIPLEGPQLTPREKEVFSLLLTDTPPKKIAKLLGVSNATVGFHTTNLYRKLGVQSRTELLVKYGGQY